MLNFLKYLFGYKQHTAVTAPLLKTEQEEKFVWKPVKDKAIAEAKLKATEELEKYEVDLEAQKAAFNIDVSVFRDSSLKIALYETVHVIPLDEIRTIILKKGKPARIGTGGFIVHKDGKYEPEYGFGSLWEETSFVYSDKAWPAEVDQIFITPNIKFCLPFGMGSGILEKIQELMATYEVK